MQRLAVELRRRHGPLASIHVGDLPWRMYQHLDRMERERLQLWLDGDDVVGWGWLGKGELDFEVHPERLDLIPEIIGWSDASTVWQLIADEPRVRAVEAAGYTRPDDRWYEHMFRALDVLPTPTVPPGYRIRAVTGDADLERRVDVHRAAFAPSRVVVESYRNVTRAYPYRAAFDQVALAPDGSFAAFALGWLDEENAVGELEPVGTHPDHRRKGLAAAVSLAALGALANAGARGAVIYSNGGSEASRVYERIGFRTISRHLAYRRA
jgi:ribosomal protein S18 acetylase RimI-like enzyme